MSKTKPWSLRNWLREDVRDDEAVDFSFYEKQLALIGIGTLKATPHNDIAKALDWGFADRMLWEEGRVMVWRSPMYGLTVTRCVETGYDKNGLPVEWAPIFVSGDERIQGKRITEADGCVVIYDTPFINLKRSDALMRVRELVNVKSTIRTQVDNQATPMLAIAGKPSLREKVKDFAELVVNKAKCIVVEKEIVDDLQVLDFKAPFNVETLEQEKSIVFSEILQFMGVDSRDAFAKKERLVVDEQEGNDELLNYILASFLRPRARASEKLKALGVDVTWDVQELVRRVDEEETVAKEGEDEAIED